MLAKNVLVLLGLEESLCNDSFRQAFSTQLRVIEVLLASPYFERIHIGVEKSLCRYEGDLPLISSSNFLEDPIFENASGIFLTGFHYYVEDIAVQLKHKNVDSAVVLIKNAIIAPHEIDYSYLNINQVQVEPV
jgi:hypothetical protein